MHFLKAANLIRVKHEWGGVKKESLDYSIVYLDVLDKVLNMPFGYSGFQNFRLLIQNYKVNSK